MSKSCSCPHLSGGSLQEVIRLFCGLRFEADEVPGLQCPVVQTWNFPRLRWTFSMVYMGHGCLYGGFMMVKSFILHGVLWWFGI